MNNNVLLRQPDPPTPTLMSKVESKMDQIDKELGLLIEVTAELGRRLTVVSLVNEKVDETKGPSDAVHPTESLVASRLTSFLDEIHIIRTTLENYLNDLEI